MKDRLAPPNNSPISTHDSDDIMPFVNATTDEIGPFVASLFIGGETPEAAFGRLLKIGHAEENKLNALPRDKPLDPTLLRAMIYRYTAAGIALLALDERVRGEEVIAREMAQLDKKGGA